MWGLSLLKLPWVKVLGGAAVVVAFLYVSGLRVQIISLESEVHDLNGVVAELTKVIAEKEIENDRLNLSVQLQNESIESWIAAAETKEKQIQTLLKKMEQDNIDSEIKIRQLRTANPTSCEQGIQVLDEVLGL